jgi:hypothetical protein
MFGSITRWLRRKPSDEVEGRYVLPSDDPELSPITITDQSAELLPAECELPLEAAPSASARNVAAVQDGLAELASQVRTLGQRVQAQAIGNARLLEALNALPTALRDAMPGGTDHTLALNAMRDALAENAGTNSRLCEALTPLQHLAAMPAKAEAQLDALQQVARHQRRQVKQQMIALRAGKEVVASQRKHYTEMETSSQARLGAIQHESAQNFFKLEQHLRRSTRMQLAATCAAIMLALGSLTAAAFAFNGETPEPVPARQAVDERNFPKDTLVQK